MYIDIVGFLSASITFLLPGSFGQIGLRLGGCFFHLLLPVATLSNSLGLGVIRYVFERVTETLIFFF